MGAGHLPGHVVIDLVNALVIPLFLRNF